MLYSIISFFGKLSYELMWLFSYVEITFTRAYNQIILPVKNNELLKFINTSVAGEIKPIHFVKNGDVIHKTTRNGSLDFNEDYDFLVDTTLSHEVIYDSIPDNFDDYIVSNTEFILTELFIGEHKMKINFVDKSQGYTYAIVNNKIDLKFLMFFIKKHYHHMFCLIFNIPVAELVNGYNLKIIDGNVNMLTINEEQILCYTKNGYIIESVDKSDVVDDSQIEPNLDHLLED